MTISRRFALIPLILALALTGCTAAPSKADTAANTVACQQLMASQAQLYTAIATGTMNAGSIVTLLAQQQQIGKQTGTEFGHRVAEQAGKSISAIQGGAQASGATDAGAALVKEVCSPLGFKVQ